MRGGAGKQDRNNAGQGDDRAAHRGRRSDVVKYIEAKRDPEWHERLGGARRKDVDRCVEKMELFPLPVRALIVFLEERILTVHDSRTAYAESVHPKDPKQAKELLTQLNYGLGNHRRKPKGLDWWLAEQIVQRTSQADERQRALDQIARLWHAGRGKAPPGWECEPATQAEIDAIIVPPASARPLRAETTRPQGAGEEDNEALARTRGTIGDYRRELRQAEQELHGATRALDREQAKSLAAESQIAELKDELSRLRVRLQSAERAARGHSDDATRAQATAAELRETIAQLLAHLEVSGLKELPYPAPMLSEFLPTSAIRSRQRLSSTAHPAHRAVGVYVGTHLTFSSRSPEELAKAAGMSVELIERLLSADHLPGRDITVRIAQAAGGQADYAGRLWAAAEHHSAQSPFDQEFYRIIAQTESDPEASDQGRDASPPRSENEEPEVSDPGKALRNIRSLFSVAYRRVEDISLPAVIGLGVCAFVFIVSGLILDQGYGQVDVPLIYTSGDPPVDGWELKERGGFHTQWRADPYGNVTNLQGELVLSSSMECRSEVKVQWELSINGTRMDGGVLYSPTRGRGDSLHLEEIKVRERPYGIDLRVRRLDNTRCNGWVDWNRTAAEPGFNVSGPGRWRWHWSPGWGRPHEFQPILPMSVG
ncbi:hypothetical protein AGRA3207_000294 [Actinomadura graeca]|uniref:Uncharacterized protein n=1 Tax=Actinomadura graeca TaxID=2750812 RepID=A0ABX8QM09_9ACTN|nr:hypothetical protein [Actinomadura graeca]QXJ19716.1 hypothetical protein AGRA3207_000294 [Actinomadura graeca]